MGHTRRHDREEAARRSMKKMRSTIDKHPKKLYTEASAVLEREFQDWDEYYEQYQIDDIRNVR